MIDCPIPYTSWLEMNSTTLMCPSKLSDPLNDLFDHLLKEDTLEVKKVCTVGAINHLKKKSAPFSTLSIDQEFHRRKFSRRARRSGMRTSGKGQKKKNAKDLNDAVVESFAQFTSKPDLIPDMQGLYSDPAEKSKRDLLHRADRKIDYQEELMTDQSRSLEGQTVRKNRNNSTSQPIIESSPNNIDRQQKRVRLLQEEAAALAKNQPSSLPKRLIPTQLPGLDFSQVSDRAKETDDAQKPPASDESSRMRDICAKLDSIDLNEREGKRQRLNRDSFRTALLRQRKPSNSNQFTSSRSNKLTRGKNSAEFIVESWRRPSLNPSQDGFEITNEGSNEKEVMKTTSNKNHKEHHTKKDYPSQVVTDCSQVQQATLFEKPEKSPPLSIPPIPKPPTTSTKRGRKNRKKKDNTDGRPKQPLSAYNIFFKDERSRILASVDPLFNTSQSSVESATSTESMNVEGSESVSTPFKQPVINESVVTNQKIDFAMNSEPATVSDIPPLEGTAVAGIDNGKEEKPKKRGRGRPRGPNYVKPKPPHRKISFQKLAQIIGSKWKQRTPDIAAEYSRRAKLERKRYDEQLAIYNANQRLREEKRQRQLSNEKKGKDSSGSVVFNSESDNDQGKESLSGS